MSAPPDSSRIKPPVRLSRSVVPPPRPGAENAPPPAQPTPNAASAPTSAAPVVEARPASGHVPPAGPATAVPTPVRLARNDAKSGLTASVAYGDRMPAWADAPLTRFLRDMVERNASDLLFVAGWPPTFNVAGHWAPSEWGDLSEGDIRNWLAAVFDDAQKQRFETTCDVDFALRLPGVGRFRVNAHVQNQEPAVAVRAIPGVVPQLADLGLPEDVARLAGFPNGLVLVTGGAGHGKSTTLAALINQLNETRACHIITLEDPVEFEFPRGLAVIEQREIGIDSPNFGSALRHVVRQRPDVILIGEMRDLETISTALTAAETGHLVLASLHTNGAVQALARIIDVFPAAQQQHVRTQVAASLRAILCQVLLPTKDGRGRVPAAELLFATDAVRRAIRDNETHLIHGIVETGRNSGMITLEQSLAIRAKSGLVDPAVARLAAAQVDRFDRLMLPRNE